VDYLPDLPQTVQESGLESEGGMMYFAGTVQTALSQIQCEARDFREAANGNYRCWRCGKFFPKSLFGTPYQCPAIANGWYSDAICPHCGGSILRYTPQ
jgi:rRNA maturation endonuclease Nob1